MEVWVMFKQRSKILFLGNILGTMYAFYLMSHFFGSVSSTEGAEQIGAGIATAIILPHLVAIILSVLFGFMGFFMKKDGFNLTSGILYCVATALFLLYFMFTLPLIIFAFIGYSKQKQMSGSHIKDNVIIESIK